MSKGKPVPNAIGQGLFVLGRSAKDSYATRTEFGKDRRRVVGQFKERQGADQRR